MTSERLTLLQSYRDRGFITIPTNLEKKPLVTFKDIFSQNDPRCVIKPGQNVAILTGYRSKMILLDIDRPSSEEYDGRKFMAAMFPDIKTATVKSPKGFHMWFTITDDRVYQIRNTTRVFTCDNRPVSIDIRSNGGYALVPPSFTADGLYIWENPLSEATPMPDAMIDLLLAKTHPKPHSDLDVIAHPVENIREIIRCFKKTATHVNSQRANSYSDWVLYLFALAHYMNDPNISDEDFRQLEKCAHRFSKRSSKYDPQETTDKLQSLIDSGSRTTVATPLYWLKTDNPTKFASLYKAEEWIHEGLKKDVEDATNEITCIEDFIAIADRPNGHLLEFYIKAIPLVIARIGSPRMYYIRLRGGTRDSFTSRAFRENSYGNDLFKVIVNNKVTETTLYELANKYAKQYERITFSVDNTHDARQYNTYPGLATSYIPEARRDLAAVAFYNNHMKNVLCSGDEFLYNYLTKWLSEAFHGKGRSLPALVFKGIQGCGKSIFWVDLVMTRIFSECGAPIRSIKDLTKDFNGIISRKTLLVADETGTGKNKYDRNIMKTALTAVRSLVERKGQEATVEDLYFAAVFLTNDMDSVPIEENDRRFICVDITAAIHDKPYFAQFLRYNQNNHACSSWYSDILDRAEKIDLDVSSAHVSSMKIHMMINTYPLLTYIRDICLGIRDVLGLLDQHDRAGAQVWYDDFRRAYPRSQYNSIHQFIKDFSKWTTHIVHTSKKLYKVSRTAFEGALREAYKIPEFVLE